MALELGAGHGELITCELVRKKCLHIVSIGNVAGNLSRRTIWTPLERRTGIAYADANNLKSQGNIGNWAEHAHAHLCALLLWAWMRVQKQTRVKG